MKLIEVLPERPHYLAITVVILQYHECARRTRLVLGIALRVWIWSAVTLGSCCWDKEQIRHYKYSSRQELTEVYCKAE